MKLKTWPIVAGTLTDLVARSALGLFCAVALVTWHAAALSDS